VVRKLSIATSALIALRASRRKLGIAAVLIAQCTVIGVAHAQSHPDLAGVWLITKPVFEVKTVDGATPPFLPGVEKTYRQRIAARHAGDISFDQSTWCASVGIPRLMFIPYSFEIVERPNRVAFLYTWNWWARTVDMSGAKLDVLTPTSMGVASGKWDGNSLVVETKGLEESTLIDSAGMPHSGEITVTERLSLKDPNVLEDRIKIDDPKTFTGPWDTLVTYQRKPGGQVQEDVCLDRIRAGKPAVMGDQ
jgi:hypothetical protein